MKNKKTIALILFWIIITIIFFTYGLTITHDSSHYLWLSSLMTEGEDFTQWDVGRGPVFPLFLKVTQIFFGPNSNGFLVATFIFYLLMLLFSYLIYKDTIQNEEVCSKKFKWVLGILFVLLVVVNPMIIGYYHTLLTEFIAMTFAVIGCYLSWKWMQINFKENKLQYILYTIVLAILTAIAWQLKQPYVGTILFPVIIAAIISFVRKVNLKNFLQRGFTVLICMIMLVIGIQGWNLVIKVKNVNIDNTRTTGGFLALGLLEGIKEYNIKNGFETIQAVQENTKISQEDKEKMVQVLENNSEYQSFTVIDTNQENYEIIYSKGKVISTLDATKFLLNTLIKNPKVILGCYLRSYLVTISMYSISFDGPRVLQTGTKLEFTNTQEIDAIGFKIYNYGTPTNFLLLEKYEPYAKEYEDVNKPVVAINWLLRNLQIPSAIAMKISFILLPILTIASIVAVFRTKKRYNEKYTKIIDLITILYSFSFMNIVAHALLGSSIDRYTMPALATTFIAILLSIYAIIYRKQYKNK